METSSTHHHRVGFAGIAALGLILGSGPARASDPGEPRSEPPIPVSQVDLTRYVGTWYELAKIPNRFQTQCVGGTTAEYNLRDDGKIEVVNRCRTKDGEIDEAKGIARVVDRRTNSRLEVSFFSVLGIRPFWGDYWILGLGSNYEYAVVGSEDREYGWILSRKPDPTPDILEEAWATVRAQGFDPSDFEATPHRAR